MTLAVTPIVAGRDTGHDAVRGRTARGPAPRDGAGPPYAKIQGLPSAGPGRYDKDAPYVGGGTAIERHDGETT
ncbi:hypothetical protein OG339_19165 [Streptosporangium sp. NBC_01495]|uniref:hypothetical protein n=1 Tax=Streptosporangium sp. NBC_01495 TaxID=2903899 RepID=UPI002E37835A|nr:hypothetical protein [Streptosporangium sp. NBC_01495]